MTIGKGPDQRLHELANVSAVKVFQSGFALSTVDSVTYKICVEAILRQQLPLQIQETKDYGYLS